MDRIAMIAIVDRGFTSDNSSTFFFLDVLGLHLPLLTLSSPLFFRVLSSLGLLCCLKTKIRTSNALGWKPHRPLTPIFALASRNASSFVLYGFILAPCLLLSLRFLRFFVISVFLPLLFLSVPFFFLSVLRFVSLG